MTSHSLITSVKNHTLSYILNNLLAMTDLSGRDFVDSHFQVVDSCLAHVLLMRYGSDGEHAWPVGNTLEWRGSDGCAGRLSIKVVPGGRLTDSLSKFINGQT